MGALVLLHFDYEGLRRAPPSEAELRAYMRSDAAGDEDIESLDVGADAIEVVVSSAISIVSLAYLYRFMTTRGARPRGPRFVRRGTRPDAVLVLPPFVEHRWTSLPLWTRIRLRWMPPDLYL